MESKTTMHVLFCLIVSLLVIQNVSSARNLASVRFDKLATFLYGRGLHTDDYIHHMEVDLYKNDGSLLFCGYRFMRSTDGKMTETIVGSNARGYQEGKGTSVQFGSIFGFKQINASHVAIADSSNHCIRMLNRKTQTTSHLAGVCTADGFTNGKSGKFSSPGGIEISPNNPDKLFVTDYSNNALRSIDNPTGEVNTVLSTGLKLPRGLSWNFDKTSLFITNAHYITEVKFDNEGKVISNVILAGSTAPGSADGAFKSAQFYVPAEITPITKNLNIVADANNDRVRILDTLTNRTVRVCLSSATTCNYPYVLLHSVLVVGTDVYIGSHREIYKLSGYRCSAENITAYLPADKDKVEVKISGDYSAELTVGTHKFKNLQRNDECGSFFVIVRDYLVNKRVELKAVYRVSCSKVNHPNTKSIFLSVVESHFQLLQRICVNDCTRQHNSQAITSCADDTLSVIWPTDRIFPANETVNAARLQKTLNERAQKDKQIFQLVIVNQVPPVVQPKTLEVVVTEFCPSDKIYMHDSQTCQ